LFFNLRFAWDELSRASVTLLFAERHDDECDRNSDERCSDSS
jgi:hypothetical protein